MQQKSSPISQVHAVVALPAKIIMSPRRSYTQLQQALAQAEAITERTLCEMLALRQSQMGDNTNANAMLQSQQHLQQLIKQAQRNGTGFAVFYLQVDDYQTVAHRYGAAVTQQVSALISARLLGAVRACDQVSKQADGQFLLLITDVKRVFDTVLVAEKLLKKLAALNGLCQATHAIAVSIGISRYPQDGADGITLIERAAAALLCAQQRGGNQFSLLR
ncbi:diguanylate cyclase domain-containing protein [Rheinheimera fenheensis]|uniref:diguanylate cyclase domain-containing protein n=1 Tax=Rheinheimera fenheensis TaxID=3152295 RepID=UPI00325E0ABC